MMKYLVLLTLAIVIVSGQTWVSRARLNDHATYWHTLMQEMIYEVEKREWCNLKVNDITSTMDQNLFNMHVNGTATYTNGFVVSIQKIDLTEVQQSTSSRTVDGEVVPFISVRGRLNFRDILVGYDVHVKLTSPSETEFKTTATFLYLLINVQMEIAQNIITKELTASPLLSGSNPSPDTKMNYMPSNSITEAFGRSFRPNQIESVTNWARNIFAPIMLDLATNKIKFPTICFNNCS